MQEQRYKTFNEFFPYYLSVHSHRSTKWIHAVTTSFAMVFLVITLVTGKLAYVVSAWVATYAILFLSHFLIEKNRPATFRYPWWSILADFKMAYLLFKGKL